jgi:hypothetical protein
MARQIQFSDQICRLCTGGNKETVMHVLGGECPLHASNDTSTGREVLNLIRKRATTHVEYVDHIPLWFPHGDIPPTPFLLPIKDFSALAAYDKLLGGLGYVPSSLREALGHFGIPNRSELIRDIAVLLAKSAHDKWKKRCKTMISGESWSAAESQATVLIHAGVG